VNARLNRAYALARLAEFDEAEQLVMIEFGKDKPNLSPHGIAVSENILAMIRTGQGRYDEAAAFYRSTLDREPSPEAWGTQLCYMNAAGRAGGLEGFERARKYCREMAGERFTQRQCHIDALEAFLLSENGRREDAARLVERWRDDARSQHAVEDYYSRPYLKTADVVATWKALLAGSAPPPGAGTAKP
jgi:hypothetical protein